MVGRVVDFKCGKCGYKKRVYSGGLVKGEGFVYFGCPHCKEIISIKSEEKTSHCPKCNTDIIDYDSDAYRKLKGGKKLDLCPKCMKWELKKETPDVRI